MIAELARLRGEREAAATEVERIKKRNAWRTKLAWRLFIFWPSIYIGLRLLYWIGYESGLSAACISH